MGYQKGIKWQKQGQFFRWPLGDFLLQKLDLYKFYFDFVNVDFNFDLNSDYDSDFNFNFAFLGRTIWVMLLFHSRLT
jgi:hypothetical protein